MATSRHQRIPASKPSSIKSSSLLTLRDSGMAPECWMSGVALAEAPDTSPENEAVK
jgi:hypothetical protein